MGDPVDLDWVVDDGDHGGFEPPEPPSGGGGGPSGTPPRREWGIVLPSMIAGAGFIAMERVTLLVLAAAGFSTGARTAAALTLIFGVALGVLGGGVLFLRAWRADREGQ